MTGVFRPRLDVLPAAQRRLWPELRHAAAAGFVLYGGTAIALRLGHRHSVDFDFFSEQALDRQAIAAAFPFVPSATVLQDERNALSVLVPGVDAGGLPVKISFFGTIGFGRVGVPQVTEDGILQVAALSDLMATKVKVILQRAEAKDYQDIAAMIEAGVSLAEGLAAAREMFGPNFQPSESLKALVYFEDGDLATLGAAQKAALVRAVSAVRGLPTAVIVSRQLTVAAA